ncbi:MAG: hypothetical protein ACLR6B_18525 [Blautia sp.]
MTSASSAKKESAGALFAKYVSQNILGMIGVSAYVLADTFLFPWRRVQTALLP